MDKTFSRVWQSRTGTSITFETQEPIPGLINDQDDPITETSFRLDVNNDGTVEIYVIGDSNEGGFLVCEEVSSEFNVSYVLAQAVMALSADYDRATRGHAPLELFNAQDEYDPWVKTYEEQDDAE